jgi:hypothetical protein
MDKLKRRMFSLLLAILDFVHFESFCSYFSSLSRICEGSVLWMAESSPKHRLFIILLEIDECGFLVGEKSERISNDCLICLKKLIRICHVDFKGEKSRHVSLKPECRITERVAFLLYAGVMARSM